MSIPNATVTAQASAAIASHSGKDQSIARAWRGDYVWPRKPPLNVVREMSDLF
jgi:hypothetical protein